MGPSVGAPVVATDGDDDTVTYTLGGIDAESFAVASTTGQLMTKIALDASTKSKYTVEVTATDTSDAADTITVIIIVTAIVHDCGGRGAVADADGNPGLVADCLALLQARDALAGGGSLNWAEDVPIADWDGVTLQGVPQRVRRLDLREKGLDGSIPSELGLLSNLTYLNLRSNELGCPIPAELGNLTNLRVLNLHSNDLSGEIPDLSTTMLEELYLTNNYDAMVVGSGLTGPVPSWLNGMSNMRELWLWGNRLSGTIPDLSGMSNLERLRLSSNNLTGRIPAELSGLSSLTLLTLQHNGLTGVIPPRLSDLSDLEWLSMHGNELTGGMPSELGDLTNLKRLYLHYNDLTGGIPAELSGLSSLTHLTLQHNRLTGVIPPWLSDLSDLEWLSLYGNELTGARYRRSLATCPG